MSRGHAPKLLLAAFTLAILVAGTVKLRSYDLFWHLEAGHWILDHRALPETDPFRYTAAPGERWSDHEWLAQVLLALGERSVGLVGLGLLQSLFGLGLAALLVAAQRRAGVPWPEAMVVVLLVILLARRRFLLQPELATFAGVVLLLVLLESWRARPRAAPLAAAVVVAVLWANAHPGALVAPVIAALYVIGLVLVDRARRGSSAAAAGSARALWLLPLALVVPMVATPNGTRIFTLPQRISAALEGLPVSNPEWEPLWRFPQPAFVIAVAAVAAIVLWRWWRDRVVDWPTLLPVVALAALTVESVRHQTLFYLAAPFAVARPLATPGESRLGPRGSALATLACIAGMVWCVLPPQSGPLRQRDRVQFGWGLAPAHYPEQAVVELGRWPDLGRLYNEDRFGGYLLWRLFPQRQIFIDGRNELHPELLREQTTAWSSAARWRALLERWNIDGAVLGYDPRKVRVMGALAGATGRPIAERSRSSLLFPGAEFALVHWDDAAMVFVRRTPERARAITAAEYRAIDPEDLPGTLDRAAHDPALRAAALAEVERRLGDDAACQRAAALGEKLRELE